MVERQNYRPYRASLLTGEQLRALSTLEPGRVVRDTLLLWAQIVGAWAIVAIWPTWWIVLLAIPVIGTRYYALFIIGHDGLHRRLFPTTAANDLWNDAVVLGPLAAITRLNRVNHMKHHATLALPSDPDRFKYIGENKATPGTYLFALTGIPFVWRAAANVFIATPTQAPADPASKATGEGYTMRDLAILAAWQVALIGGLTLSIGPWAYPVLWLIPVYVFTVAADMVRVFAEHSVQGDEASADRTMRLISFTSNPIERRFFAPMNMNFHTAHHLWPSIPYYRLPEADRLMRESANFQGGLVWRESYVRHLIDYASRLKWSRETKPA